MERYWQGVVPAQDDFGVPIDVEFIDGRTIHGPWAFMAPISWGKHGIRRLGTGSGQRYVKQDDGRWQKVEG